MRQKGYGTHLVCVSVYPSVCLSGYVLQRLFRVNDLKVVRAACLLTALKVHLRHPLV